MAFWILINNRSYFGISFQYLKIILIKQLKGSQPIKNNVQRDISSASTKTKVTFFFQARQGLHFMAS